MTIDIPAETAAQLEAKARAEGVSVGAYVGPLVLEADSRQIRLEAFRQAMEERLASLKEGESVDGEEVMARLISELSPQAQPPGVR